MSYPITEGHGKGLCMGYWYGLLVKALGVSAQLGSLSSLHPQRP